MSVKRKDKKTGYSKTERHNAKTEDTDLRFMRTGNRNAFTAGSWKERIPFRREKGNA